MTSRPPLAEQLDLTPHPEGGWFRETWRSAVSFSPDGYGGPLDLRIGGASDEPSAASTVLLGGDPSAGQQPQARVPGGVWQSAAPAGGAPVLVSCVAAPGFDFADFRL